MESHLFEIDLLTAHELGSEVERERPSTRPQAGEGENAPWYL